MKQESYQAERRQLSKVITYGMPENFSVDLCCIILLNVILKYVPKLFTIPLTWISISSHKALIWRYNTKDFE